jgi:hypothetical protein
MMASKCSQSFDVLRRNYSLTELLVHCVNRPETRRTGNGYVSWYTQYSAQDFVNKF